MNNFIIQDSWKNDLRTKLISRTEKVIDDDLRDNVRNPLFHTGKVILLDSSQSTRVV